MKINLRGKDKKKIKIIIKKKIKVEYRLSKKVKTMRIKRNLS